MARKVSCKICRKTLPRNWNEKNQQWKYESRTEDKIRLDGVGLMEKGGFVSEAGETN
jgi:hypothetical protein